MYKPVASTSKKLVSVPLTLRLLVPSPSSVISMSATLMRVVVLVFSAMVWVVFFRVTALGGWLLRARVNTRGFACPVYPAAVLLKVTLRLDPSKGAKVVKVRVPSVTGRV